MRPRRSASNASMNFHQDGELLEAVSVNNSNLLFLSWWGGQQSKTFFMILTDFLVIRCQVHNKKWIKIESSKYSPHFTIEFIIRNGEFISNSDIFSSWQLYFLIMISFPSIKTINSSIHSFIYSINNYDEIGLNTIE